MKRLLAIVAALAIGIGMAGSPAQAQTKVTSVTKGGVTCTEYDDAFTWPKTYWDCVHPSAPTGAENSIASAASSLQTTPTNLQKSLTNVQIYTFVNATQYAAFFGVTAPAANAFGATTTNVAAAFSTATQNGAAVDLTVAYTGTIVQELGHLIDAAQTAPYSGNSVFTTALAYDIVNLNAQGNSPWPAAYYTKYPGKTNWQIFQAIYPNADTDIFNYQFQQNNSSTATTSTLQLALSYMPNTLGWIKNYIYLATPTNAAAAKDGVLCVQYGYFEFPNSYWDCVHPYTPTGDENSIASAASTLQTTPTNLQAKLTNVQVYAFLNATQYADFFGVVAPAANAFGATTAKVAAAFSTATQNGVAVDLTGAYTGTIVQELGHLIDVAQALPYSGNAGFTAALNLDIAYLNAQGKSPWPSAYYTQYPGKTNYQILQAIYPNANTDIFDYEFQQNNSSSSTTSTLALPLQYFLKTYNWVRTYVYMANHTVSNGIECFQHEGDSYPENGNYFECTTSANTVSGQTALTELYSINNNSTYGKVPTVLSGGAAKFSVFDTAVAAKTYTAAPGCCTQAQLEAFYNAEANTSAATVDGPPPSTQLWVSVGVPPYPNVVLQSTNAITNTTAHETGHQFDALANGTVPANFPSQAAMTASTGKDKAYMQANDPDYATDIANNSYWLVSGNGGTDWSELFAEEFAINEVGKAILPVDLVINSYWQCSTFYTGFWMKNQRAPAAADYTAANLARCN
jgi:hypothetical protein